MTGQTGQPKTVDTVTWSCFDSTGWRDAASLQQHWALVLLRVCAVCAWTRLTFMLVCLILLICMHWPFRKSQSIKVG